MRAALPSRASRIPREGAIATRLSRSPTLSPGKLEAASQETAGVPPALVIVSVKSS